MLKSTCCLLGAVSLAAGVALAKLPPPTPAEQAAAAEKKAKQAAEAEQQKAALARAQDRVVEHYRKGTGAGGSSSTGSGQTQAKDMPKTTSALPGGVGPEPTRPPSAEAHSGENK
ncbi:MAG TPA: hypothetical protein VMN03_06495 [Burkholderiales bacterium]|nr:hypothetical protein [Burkholderiales bacterium]